MSRMLDEYLDENEPSNLNTQYNEKNVGESIARQINENKPNLMPVSVTSKMKQLDVDEEGEDEENFFERKPAGKKRSLTDEHAKTRDSMRQGAGAIHGFHKNLVPSSSSNTSTKGT